MDTDTLSLLQTLSRQLKEEADSPGGQLDPVEPTADIVDAAISEMTRGHWETALEGFTRARSLCGDKTPRPIYIHAATCLHRLGKYADAEKMAFEGLGAQRSLITLKSSPPSEETLRRHWPRGAPPLVSIVCTTYNHERYIETAIRGFLSQETRFPFEILIHDDASTDGTTAIIRNWEARYPSIIRTVLQQENQFSRGVCPFNLLLQQTRGRYVATCEGDDYWIEPSKLQKQVDFLEEHADFSCSAHNYFLYTEARLSVRRWIKTSCDRIFSERQLMNVTRLLWLPTLVFRKTFSSLPRERGFAPIGDQFLTSYLGTFGKCFYFEDFLGAVRRENQYSLWTPLSDLKKEHIRVKTWVALVRMHENRGHYQAVADLLEKIARSPLADQQKSTLISQSLEFQSCRPAAESLP